MTFFTLLYIRTNRFSEEKIAVAILANIEGIPYFEKDESKLNFALKNLSPDMRKLVKKGIRLMDFDVNKIRRGETSLSFFDPPYAKRMLKEISQGKRGVLCYSELYELEKVISFDKLFAKYIGTKSVSPSKTKPNTFKARFKDYIDTQKFAQFAVNYKLKANSYPFIYRDMTIDLCRKSNYFTVFHTVDFSKSIQTIQTHISRFRLIVQSLQQVSQEEGLGTGRYYMVYESTSAREKMELIKAIRAEKNMGYKIIRMTEMKDYV